MYSSPDKLFIDLKQREQNILPRLLNCFTLKTYRLCVVSPTVENTDPDNRTKPLRREAITRMQRLIENR